MSDDSLSEWVKGGPNPPQERGVVARRRQEISPSTWAQAEVEQRSAYRLDYRVRTAETIAMDMTDAIVRLDRYVEAQSVMNPVALNQLRRIQDAMGCCMPETLGRYIRGEL